MCMILYSESSNLGSIGDEVIGSNSFLRRELWMLPANFAELFLWFLESAASQFKSLFSLENEFTSINI